MTGALSGLSFPDACTRRLFERGLCTPWSVEQVLEWQTLALDRIPAPVRRSLAALYADVLYAEMLGVEVMRKVADLAPQSFLRAYAAQQVADELRHVQFFTRVVQQLGPGEEVSDSLVALRSELARSRDPDELVLHIQVLELSAEAVLFTSARRTLSLLSHSVRLPGSESVARLVRCILQNVAQDESRHIAFVHRYLRGRRTEFAPRRRPLQERASMTAHLMHRTFERHKTVLARVATGSEHGLRRSFLKIQDQLARVGIEIDDVGPA